ncbi:MAG: DUF975 family protein [Rhodospirillaceae bacterium]
MLKPNSTIMHDAWQCLHGHRGILIVYLLGAAFFMIMTAIALGFVLSLTGIQEGMTGNLVSFIITPLIMVGFNRLYLQMSEGVQPNKEALFYGLSCALVTILTYILTSIFTVLWLLLLIIPGLIAMLNYSQVYFIIAEQPEISALESIRQSKSLMKGKRWKFFRLYLRFVLWSVPGFLTMGIGFLWLLPWFGVSLALFYRDVKQDHAANLAAITATPAAS